MTQKAPPLFEKKPSESTEISQIVCATKGRKQTIYIYVGRVLLSFAIWTVGKYLFAPGRKRDTPSFENDKREATRTPEIVDVIGKLSQFSKQAPWNAIHGPRCLSAQSDLLKNTNFNSRSTHHREVRNSTPLAKPKNQISSYVRSIEKQR